MKKQRKIKKEKRQRIKQVKEEERWCEIETERDKLMKVIFFKSISGRFEPSWREEI